MYILDCVLTNSTNVAEPRNYRVQLWRKNSSIGQILINNSGLCVPNSYSHIVLDKQMNIYVEMNGEIRQWFSSKNYTYNITIGGLETLVKYSNSYMISHGLYIDDNLTMYIIDQSHETIEKWFPNFILPIKIKTTSKTSSGLILDCNQFFYYGDLLENIIYQFNPITNQTRIVLDLNLQQQLEQFGRPPLIMKFDKFYNMFVMDRRYSRIIKHSIL
ncbi:unnamed protein product [Rotaria sp. Silwood1]|nr:unnamed protein product [Rotaria sp. Silwood1]